MVTTCCCGRSDDALLPPPVPHAAHIRNRIYPSCFAHGCSKKHFNQVYYCHSTKTEYPNNGRMLEVLALSLPVCSRYYLMRLAGRDVRRNQFTLRRTRLTPLSTSHLSSRRIAALFKISCELRMTGIHGKRLDIGHKAFAARSGILFYPWYWYGRLGRTRGLHPRGIFLISAIFHVVFFSVFYQLAPL